MSATLNAVEFLLAEDTRATTAAHALSEMEAWPEALALAQVWKVIPQLSARLQSLRFKLNPQDTGTLRREFLRVHAQSASRATKAIAAILELECAAISVVAFKGIASMAVLYGGPKNRTVGDGDLLLLRKDLPNALACLERKGFARHGAETLDQYLHFVENAPRFAGNQAIALYGDDGSEIDLHWEIAGSGLHTDEVLARSVKATLMGSAIPVVDAKDGFLLTVHHALREDLGIESVCRDLLDTGLWCDYLENAGQLKAAMQWAAQSGSLVAALAVTDILRGYDDKRASARAADLLSRSATPAQRQSAARLAELFHYQMRGGRLAKDVFFLVHARPWRQILKGLALDWSGYRQSMKTLEKQLGDGQALHKRVVQLARSIPGPRGLRLARELARAKYRG